MEYSALVTTQQREPVYLVEEPEAGLSHGSRENRAQRVGRSLHFAKPHSHQADFLLLGSEHLHPTGERSRIARTPGVRLLLPAPECRVDFGGEERSKDFLLLR